ncbi:MAG: hypothetical protein IJU48_08970 [Synergistaceae bacterium]|nr:hypothetical protein [Synergistaceae bacterium]
MADQILSTGQNQNQTQKPEIVIRPAAYSESSTDISQAETEELKNAPDVGVDDEAPQGNIDDEKKLFTRELARPLWLLYGSQLLWASSDFGFQVQQREYFRQRVQVLINFLSKEFQGKKSYELLLALRGFFVKDGKANKANETSDDVKTRKKEKDPGAWLDNLDNVGIVYGKNKILLITSLRASKGQGKSRGSISLPEGIEHLWLERELSKPENHVEDPFSWKHFYKGGDKNSMHENLLTFCEGINKVCKSFKEPEILHETDGTPIYGIGLKNIEFSYTETGLHGGEYPTKLNMWQDWWNIKNGIQPAEKRKKEKKK